MSESKKNLTREEKLQRDLERIGQLRLIDDDFMTIFFDGDTVRTEFILRIILSKPDLKVIKVVGQKVIKNLRGRSVRLDVFARDSAGSPYDIEIQRASEGAKPKRARLNSALMDADETVAGDKSDNLPDSYVIFITEHDLYKQGLPLYVVERHINGAELFNDGSHIVYVNGEYRGNDAIGDLMHDFSCTDSREMRNEILAEKVSMLKGSEEERMGVLDELREEYREEYREEGQIDMAIRLIKLGELSEEKVQKIFQFDKQQMNMIRRRAAATQ